MSSLARYERRCVETTFQALAEALEGSRSERDEAAAGVTGAACGRDETVGGYVYICGEGHFGLV